MSKSAPGPRITRLPKTVQPLAMLVRPLVHRGRDIARRITGGELLSDYTHRSDRMATRSIVGFLDDPRFVSAYKRGVQAGGWDFRIPYRVHQAIWCADLASRIDGDFVELGTGRGFVMSAVLAASPTWGKSARKLHLFDTFESGWVTSNGRGEKSPYYAESAEAVIANFSEWKNVEINVGDVYETLPASSIERVAFVHVDLNAAEVEVWALRLLWDRIPAGGVILLDDFANVGRDEQHGAMLSLARELNFSILYTASGQGIVIK